MSQDSVRDGRDLMDRAPEPHTAVGVSVRLVANWMAVPEKPLSPSEHVALWREVLATHAPEHPNYRYQAQRSGEETV